MKVFVGILALVMSFATLASSGETKTFIYDGTQNSVELVLKGEKTHTEYRYENRQSICYRTEVVGYRTTCNGGPRGPRTCYQQPVYRQVAYPCTQTVSIPYEVKDYDVDAKIIVDVTNLTGLATSGEKFVVTLHGDSVVINAEGSKKFFLMLKKQSLRGSVVGSIKFIDGLYAIEMIEAAPVLKALNLTKISLSDSVLSFNLGPIANRSMISFALDIVQKRKLASDRVIFNRELASSEIALSINDESSAAKVNVKDLGVTLRDGKFSVTAKAFYNGIGTLMNKSQFSDDLKASRTLIYTVK